MDLAPYRSWLVLLHIPAVFAFLLIRGASVAVSLKLRSERDRERIRVCLELSNAYLGTMYVALLLLLISGILSGIAGGWWTSGQLWIWASVVLLVALLVLMYVLPVAWFNELRHAIGLTTYADTRSKAAPPPPADDARLAGLLASPRPIQTARVGLGGIAIVTWLMVLKPL